MKRFWIMLVACAMALAIAAPATGKKPPNEEPAPTRFDVTFAFVNGNDGFSTEQCTAGGSLTMKAGPGGRLIATGDEGTDVPLLDVRLPVDSERYYPYYSDVADVPGDFDPEDYPPLDFDPEEYPPLKESPLTGCHGAGIDVLVDKTTEPDKISIEQYPRFLMLTIRNGSVDFRWEADYYRESELTESTESKNPRKNQVNQVTTAWEGFSYLDSQLAWTGNWDKTTTESTGVVTGKINVEYVNHRDGREPFIGSPVTVKFTMTITATSELKLIKEVSGSDDSPDLWNLNATNAGQAEFTDQGGSGTFHDVDHGVGYVLSESGGPTDGYVASDWSCTAGGALVGSMVTLTAGASVTCTITNTYTPTAEPSE